MDQFGKRPQSRRGAVLRPASIGLKKQTEALPDLKRTKEEVRRLTRNEIAPQVVQAWTGRSPYIDPNGYEHLKKLVWEEKVKPLFGEGLQRDYDEEFLDAIAWAQMEVDERYIGEQTKTYGEAAHLRGQIKAVRGPRVSRQWNEFNMSESGPKIKPLNSDYKAKQS